MFRFTIRELLWAILAAAFAVAWYIEHARNALIADTVLSEMEAVRNVMTVQPAGTLEEIHRLFARDLLWAGLVAVILVSWIIDRRRLTSTRRRGPSND